MSVFLKALKVELKYQEKGKSGFKIPGDLLWNGKSTLIQAGEDEDYQQVAVSCLLWDLHFTNEEEVQYLGTLHEISLNYSQTYESKHRELVILWIRGLVASGGFWQSVTCKYLNTDIGKVIFYRMKSKEYIWIWWWTALEVFLFPRFLSKNV